MTAYIWKIKNSENEQTSKSTDPDNVSPDHDKIVTGSDSTLEPHNLINETLIGMHTKWIFPKLKFNRVYKNKSFFPSVTVRHKSY